MADRIAAPLDIRLLGPFEARVGEASLPRPRSLKGQSLLALLALRPAREVSRQWLSGTLWPESDQERAFASLRQSLRDLRAVLGPASPRLRASPRTVCLDVDAADVDAAVFDTAIRRGDPRSLLTAVSLYRGPLLEGCAEEWVLGEREARAGSYVAALEQLARHSGTRGDLPSAERYLRLAVAADPSREGAWRALMESLAAQENHAGVLQAFRDLSACLRQALDAEPSPATVAVFERLRAETRRGTPVRQCPSETAARLPRPLTGLVGREDDVARVRGLARTRRLVTLCGAGGVGKTRLGIQVAEEERDQALASVAFVDLSSLADPALLPETLVHGLRLTASARAPLDQLQDHLRAHPLLLVLDGCEHLVEACAALAAVLLQHCPQLRILATSRQKLGVGGETAWRVPSLPFPPPDGSTDPAGLTEYPAVRLFLERAGAELPGFTLDAATGPAVARICRQLDGIPLAIELAAARLTSLSAGEIADRLEECLTLLTRGPRTAAPRHQTLEALLDWSYRLLSDPERVLLQRLSIFRGGWTLEAAEAVCEERGTGDRGQGTGGTQSAFLDRVGSLVDRSLVTWTEARGRRRYRLLETIRQYAWSKLRASGEVEAVRQRHREFYVRLAEEAEPFLNGAEQAAWLSRLEQEHDNFRAALGGGPGTGDGRPGSGAAINEPVAALRLAGALGKFWYVRGHLAEGSRWLAAVLAAEPASQDPSESRLRARALNWAGVLAWAGGDCPAARRLHAESLALRRSLGDKYGTAASLQNLAACSHADPDAARALYQESLDLWRALGDRHGIATALHNLGNICRLVGEWDAARQLQGESLALKRSLGDQHGIAASLHNLGLVALATGEYEAARSMQEQSLLLRRELQDRHGIAASLAFLGDAARLRSDFPAARAFYAESLELRWTLGNRAGVAYSLQGFAALALAEAGADGSSPVARGEAARRAARLLGAIDALWDDLGRADTPAEKRPREEYARAARRELGDEAFAAAWAEGRALLPGDAVGWALEAFGPLQ